MVLITQETMNFWKQTTHIMSYFKEENFRGDKRLPNSFMTGFLEVSLSQNGYGHGRARREHQGQEQGDQGHPEIFDAVSRWIANHIFNRAATKSAGRIRARVHKYTIPKNISAKVTRKPRPNRMDLFHLFCLRR